MGYVSLEKSLDWLPWVGGENGLDFKPGQMAWTGWKGQGGGRGPTKYQLYKFEKFLDTQHQYGKIVDYLEGTTFLKHVECDRNVQIVSLDNPIHFKDFYAKTPHGCWPCSVAVSIKYYSQPPLAIEVLLAPQVKRV